MSKDEKFYKENGLLHILDRNRRIKQRPEKFQLASSKFDVILTCEEKVYDLVVAYFEENDSINEQPVHVINIEIVSIYDLIFPAYELPFMSRDIFSSSCHFRPTSKREDNE